MTDDTVSGQFGQYVHVHAVVDEKPDQDAAIILNHNTEEDSVMRVMWILNTPAVTHDSALDEHPRTPHEQDTL